MNHGLVGPADGGHQVQENIFADGACIKNLSLLESAKEIDDLGINPPIERSYVPFLDLALGIELA